MGRGGAIESSLSQPTIMVQPCDPPLLLLTKHISNDAGYAERWEEVGRGGERRGYETDDRIGDPTALLDPPELLIERFCLSPRHTVPKLTPDGNTIKEMFKFGSDRNKLGPLVRAS